MILAVQLQSIASVRKPSPRVSALSPSISSAVTERVCSPGRPYSSPGAHPKGGVYLKGIAALPGFGSARTHDEFPQFMLLRQHRSLQKDGGKPYRPRSET